MDDPLASCPRGVDVLVSHARISDDELNRIRPRIHAYGHIHSDHGMHVRVGPDWHVLCLNASICDNYYRAIQHPVVVDLVV